MQKLQEQRYGTLKYKGMWPSLEEKRRRLYQLSLSVNECSVGWRLKGGWEKAHRYSWLWDRCSTFQSSVHHPHFASQILAIAFLQLGWKVIKVFFPIPTQITSIKRIPSLAEGWISISAQLWWKGGAVWAPFLEGFQPHSKFRFLRENQLP